jgi:hypothetical protein
LLFSSGWLFSGRPRHGARAANQLPGRRDGRLQARPVPYQRKSTVRKALCSRLDCPKAKS